MLANTLSDISARGLSWVCDPRARSNRAKQKCFVCCCHSRVERLDHHTDLPLIRDDQTAAHEDGVDRVHDLVEAAGCAFLLREAGNAELVPLAVFNDRHQFDSK